MVGKHSERNNWDALFFLSMGITSQLIDGKKFGIKNHTGRERILVWKWSIVTGSHSSAGPKKCGKKSHKRIESTWDNFWKESQLNILLMSKPLVASKFCFWIFHEQEKKIIHSLDDLCISNYLLSSQQNELIHCRNPYCIYFTFF